MWRLRSWAAVKTVAETRQTVKKRALREDDAAQWPEEGCKGQGGGVKKGETTTADDSRVPAWPQPTGSSGVRGARAHLPGQHTPHSPAVQAGSPPGSRRWPCLAPCDTRQWRTDSGSPSSALWRSLTLLSHWRCSWKHTKRPSLKFWKGCEESMCLMSYLWGLVIGARQFREEVVWFLQGIRWKLRGCIHLWQP